MDTGSASCSRSICSRKQGTSRRWSRSIARPMLRNSGWSRRSRTSPRHSGPRRIHTLAMNGSSRILSTEKIDVRYVAKLARLALTDEEVERLGAQLTDLLEHVDTLSKLDVSQVAATAQVVESR